MKRITQGYNRNYNRMVDRLARVTTSGRRIRELDGLRFIAIGVVFIQHVYHSVVRRYSEPLPRHDLFAQLVLDQRIGVVLFFVISGFILASPFAGQHILGRRKVSLKQYYWRRITRLEPPYLIALTLSFLLLVFYWKQSFTQLLPHLLVSMLYLHNLVYHHFSTINSVAWSLEVEVQFYLLAPLLALVFLIPNKWLRRAVVLVEILFWQQVFKLSLRTDSDPPETLLNYIPYFLQGFLLADIYLVDWKENPAASVWADLIAIPGWILLPFYYEQQHLLHRIILPPMSFPFILLILCWSSFRSVYMRRFLAASFIMTVGGMCYSIYLLHLPLLNLLEVHSPVPILSRSLGLNVAVYSLLWGVPVLAASIAYFMLIEKPCMQKDWPQRLWQFLREGKPDGGSLLEPVNSESSIESLVQVPPTATAPLPPNQPVP